MGRTAGIMGKTVEDIEAIGAYLDSLPPKETKKRKQSANRTACVTVRHSFSPQEDNCRR